MPTKKFSFWASVGEAVCWGTLLFGGLLLIAIRAGFFKAHQ